MTQTIAELAEVEPAAWRVKRDLMTPDFVFNRSLAESLADIDGNDVQRLFSEDQVIALLTSVRAEHNRQLADAATQFRAANVGQVIDHFGPEIIGLKQRAEEAESSLAELRHKLAELHVAFDVVTDRAEAAEARLKGAEWQDISTAPKDGREILIGGCSYGPSVRTAHWGATAFNRKTQTYDRGWASGINYGFNPTKWMPLPAAPHPEQKGENE